LAGEADLWVDWMRSELRGEAVDVLHVVAPCAVAAGEAAAMVCATPLDDPREGPATVRHVRASQVAALMTSIGASAAICTAFGDHGSRAAARLLTDELARIRPGTAAVHDFHRDYSELDGSGRFAALAELYAFLGGSSRFVARPYLTLYCHPDRFGAPDPGRRVERPDGAPLPLWVAESRRRLEQLVSSAVSVTPATDLERAAQEGARSALEFATELLARHASEPSSEGGESP
jgi:hypothetical protein